MTYRFDDFVLEPDRRLLLRRGEPVPIQPKVFDLLCFLVLNRERVVSKAELVRRLWPDTCVTAASLTSLVKEARRSVGDDGRRQRMLRTEHRVGYRFVAEVDADVPAWSESARVIELARKSLEASIEVGSLELRARIRDFADSCVMVLKKAHTSRRQKGRAGATSDRDGGSLRRRRAGSKQGR